MTDLLLAKVVDIREESSYVKTFVFKTPTISFLPGQFVMLHVTINGEEVKRAYSISSAPQDEYLELTMQKVPGGKLTPFFHEKVRIGDVFHVSKQKGRFIYKKGMSNNIVLLAAGSGVVPMRSIVRYCSIASLATKITLIYGTKSRDQIIFMDEFRLLEQYNPHFSLLFSLTKPDSKWQGITGRIDDTLLMKNTPDTAALYYICGPIAFIKDMRSYLLSLGVQKNSIKIDAWGS